MTKRQALFTSRACATVDAEVGMRGQTLFAIAGSTVGGLMLGPTPEGLCGPSGDASDYSSILGYDLRLKTETGTVTLTALPRRLDLLAIAPWQGSELGLGAHVLQTAPWLSWLDARLTTPLARVGADDARFALSGMGDAILQIDANGRPSFWGMLALPIAEVFKFRDGRTLRLSLQPSLSVHSLPGGGLSAPLPGIGLGTLWPLTQSLWTSVDVSLFAGRVRSRSRVDLGVRYAVSPTATVGLFLRMAPSP